MKFSHLFQHQLCLYDRYGVKGTRGKDSSPSGWCPHPQDQDELKMYPPRQHRSKQESKITIFFAFLKKKNSQHLPLGTVLAHNLQYIGVEG